MQAAGNTREQFMKSYLNGMDSATDRRPFNGVARPGGALNGLDQNLDIAPFDSISNPNKSARENNPITRLAS